MALFNSMLPKKKSRRPNRLFGGGGDGYQSVNLRSQSPDRKLESDQFKDVMETDELTTTPEGAYKLKPESAAKPEATGAVKTTASTPPSPVPGVEKDKPKNKLSGIFGRLFGGQGQARPAMDPETGMAAPQQKKGGMMGKILDYALPAMMTMGAGAGIIPGLMAARKSGQKQKAGLAKQMQEAEAQKAAMAEKTKAREGLEGFRKAQLGEQAASRGLRRQLAEKSMAEKRRGSELDRSLRRELAGGGEDEVPINLRDYIKARQAGDKTSYWGKAFGGDSVQDITKEWQDQYNPEEEEEEEGVKKAPAKKKKPGLVDRAANWLAG